MTSAVTTHLAPSTGKARRLSRLIRSATNGTVIVPVDDSLIFGPFGGLADFPACLARIVAGGPDAILCFPGVLQHYGRLLDQVAVITNVTASTVHSSHTRKRLVASVEHAVASGADAVAAHVNVTSPHEGEMLAILGRVVSEADRYGLPVVAIMYPRKLRGRHDDNYDTLKETNIDRYTDLVCHASRIAVDLGADVVKTQYTGTPASFRRVVVACQPVPVVIAGGPLAAPAIALQRAHGARTAGAAGVSFGRNVFHRADPASWVRALAAIIHDGAAVREAARSLTDAGNRPARRIGGSR